MLKPNVLRNVNILMVGGRRVDKTSMLASMDEYRSRIFTAIGNVKFRNTHKLLQSVIRPKH